MRIGYLSQLDMNLLKALSAMLEEGNVTRAAARVGLSQPAMSRALSRLRETLGDRLFVPSGRGLVPTPRADALKRPLQEALRALDAALWGEAPFEPRSTARTFHVASADYFEAVGLPSLLRQLAAAPHLNLAMHPLNDARLESLRDGTLDAVIAPERALGDDIVWTRLFTENLVCLARRGHPALRHGLTLSAYGTLRHVMVTPRGTRGSAVDEALAGQGITRRIAVSVTSFLAAPRVVAESDLIATLGRRIAERATKELPVRMYEAPLSLKPTVLSIGWHERMRDDPGHAWFRRLVRAAK